MNEKKQLLKEKIPILPFMDDLHNYYVPRTALNAKMVTHIHCPSDFSLFTNRELLTRILNRILTYTIGSVQVGCIRLSCKLDHDQQRMIFKICYHREESEVLNNDLEREIILCRDLANRLGGTVSPLGEREGNTVFELALPLNQASVSA